MHRGPHGHLHRLQITFRRSAADPGERCRFSNPLTSRSTSRWIASAVFFPAVTTYSERSYGTKLLADLNNLFAEILKPVELLYLTLCLSQGRR